ncbi:hypothetical protein Cgig2_013108 [Carnegiea gigantea]|uniref:Ubiquitin-like protease family profile domain-containing protein n=1 Tax=Carnegiea gigantea TaxID=171969 RepID=A0A9Q1QMU6_9CARY|nr:hypothetical protein Cgig2_013108 [Carnegiea gigantea]
MEVSRGLRRERAGMADDGRRQQAEVIGKILEEVTCTHEEVHVDVTPLPASVVSAASECPTVDDKKVVASLALMRTDLYTDILTWEVIDADCPRQNNGHDCGVFVMIFMDVLALNARAMCFNQDDVRHLRDKCLADVLIDRIRNFPPFPHITLLLTFDTYVVHFS